MRKRNRTMTAAKRKARKADANHANAPRPAIEPVVYAARDPRDRKPSIRGGFATDGSIGLASRDYGTAPTSMVRVVDTTATRVWIADHADKATQAAAPLQRLIRDARLIALNPSRS